MDECSLKAFRSSWMDFMISLCTLVPNLSQMCSTGFETGLSAGNGSTFTWATCDCTLSCCKVTWCLCMKGTASCTWIWLMYPSAFRIQCTTKSHIFKLPKMPTQTITLPSQKKNSSSEGHKYQETHLPFCNTPIQDHLQNWRWTWIHLWTSQYSSLCIWTQYDSNTSSFWQPDVCQSV